MRLAAILLAGGASRRFGDGKLLAPWQGRTVLEASLAAPMGAGLDQVLVVTGAYHAQLAPLLAGYPVQIVLNPHWEEGISSSIRAGLQALAADPPQAVLICLGDQPSLPAQVITALVDRYGQRQAPIVAPYAAGMRRNPVLFDQRFWADLTNLQGDAGGRSILQRYGDQVSLVEFDDPTWFQDVDLPEDVAGRG